MIRRTPYALGGVFVTVAIALGAVLMWPIYASWHFWLMAGVTIVLAASAAALSVLRQWPLARLVLLGVGLFLVLGVPLAVSSALARWDALGWGFVSLLRGVLQGWKQLVTIVLPVGNYQALMVPAFLTLLVAGIGGVWCAMRSDRWWVLSVPFALLPAVFALALGPSAVSPPSRVLWLIVPAGREVLLSAAVFLVLMIMLRWRARRARRLRLGLHRGEGIADPALEVIGAARGIVVRGGPRMRGALLAAVMLALAGVVASAVAPPLVGTSPRQVVRSSVNPELSVQDFDSPLSLYRQWFDDERFELPLLEYSGEVGQGSRLRLAVLSHYDGRVFRTVNPSLGAESLTTVFRRLPYRLPGSGSGEQHRLMVSMQQYTPVWMPTLGQVVSAEFTGARGATMADGFFYNEALEAGIQVLGFEFGDEYHLDYQPASFGDVATFVRPEQSPALIDPELIPDSLSRWVQRQGMGTDGAALVQLVALLRERGYLSHSLLGADAATGASSWIGELQETVPGFIAQSSLAGHSMARIDQLFAELLLAEDEAGEQAASPQLVAAVGDDEQFAVAAALIARELGFPARVVLGFRLDPAEGGSASQPALPIAACAEGSCRGKNLTAWLEVQDAGGQWGVLDVTPQFAVPVSEQVSERSDPRIPTETTVDAPEEQDPEGVTPGSGQEQEPGASAGIDWVLLWRIVRWSGIGLLGILLLLSPLAVIMVAKRLRARSRRRASTPAGQIVGAWDEYVDAAIDWGRPAPGAQTRREQAALLATPSARALADGADKAVFAPLEPTQDAARRYWDEVEQVIGGFARGRSPWSRLRAMISLRSFTRYLPNWFQRSSRVKRRVSREK